VVDEGRVLDFEYVEHSAMASTLDARKEIQLSALQYVWRAAA
jgi:hypothetical protein